MTFKILSEVIKENNIPEDVILRSDSGWECDATEMDGIWYCPDKNEMIFTQEGSESDWYAKKEEYKCVYGKVKGND